MRLVRSIDIYIYFIETCSVSSYVRGIMNWNDDGCTDVSMLICSVRLGDDDDVAIAVFCDFLSVRYDTIWSLEDGLWKGVWR